MLACLLQQNTQSKFLGSGEREKETCYSTYSLAIKPQEWPSKVYTDDVSKHELTSCMHATDKW